MPIPVIAIAEDAVTVEITKRLLDIFSHKYILMEISKTKGTGELDKKILKYSDAAKNGTGHSVYFILRDMDKLAYPENPNHCPETEIKKLLKNREKQSNLLLRIAVTEGESWLLADYQKLCNFLRAAPKKDVAADTIKDAKEAVINIAKRSRKREYRNGIVPQSNSRKKGPLYNRIISEFIRNDWRPDEAAKHSKSLRRTLNRLEQFSL